MNRALIADDEPLLRAELREALGLAWPELQVVAEAADGREALAQGLALRPDVAFLDISMPHMDGVEAAKRLRAAGFTGELVFVTAYEQFALEAFDQRAVDYLVKPLEPARLGDTVARLKSRLQGSNAELLQQAFRQALQPPPQPRHWLRVTRATQTLLVAVRDVAAFCAVPGYTRVLTCQGEHLIDEPLKDLQPQLPAQDFLQVHRAHIVNLHFIAAIVRDRPGRCMVELKHGLGRLEASRRGAEALRNL